MRTTQTWSIPPAAHAYAEYCGQQWSAIVYKRILYLLFRWRWTNMWNFMMTEVGVLECLM